VVTPVRPRAAPHETQVGENCSQPVGEHCSKFHKLKQKVPAIQQQIFFSFCPQQANKETSCEAFLVWPSPRSCPFVVTPSKRTAPNEFQVGAQGFASCKRTLVKKNCDTARNDVSFYLVGIGLLYHLLFSL